MKPAKASVLAALAALSVVTSAAAQVLQPAEPKVVDDDGRVLGSLVEVSHDPSGSGHVMMSAGALGIVRLFVFRTFVATNAGLPTYL